MKRRLMTAVFLMCVAIFVTVGVASAQEEEVEATPLEIEEAQQIAQQFVGRMLQERDVAALFDEMFLPDFISHFLSDEFVTPALYYRLSRAERQWLFAVMYDLYYLASIAIISDHDDMSFIRGEKKLKPKMLLPRATLLKLRRAFHLLGGEESGITSYRRLRAFLSLMERALTEARVYLKRRGLEQTREFQSEFVRGDELGKGVNYRVRTYVGGRNVKDCGPLIGFPEHQKFFRVELPLYIGAILVKDGAHMKIVTLTYVDGD